MVDDWLKDVPELKIPYELNKTFSDILQLTDRQKAEALVDDWLALVIKFIESFRAEYEKTSKGWEDPYGNVPNTIAKWRKTILNYITYKDGYGRPPTNSFAEFANKQIKRAYKLGNGYNLEVLRAKVMYGGVLVKKRPPHPLDEKRTRTSRKSARAQKEADKQNAISSSDPSCLEGVHKKEHQAEDVKLKDGSTGLGPAAQYESFCNTNNENQGVFEFIEFPEQISGEKSKHRRGRRAFKYDHNQPNMDDLWSSSVEHQSSLDDAAAS